MEVWDLNPTFNELSLARTFFGVCDGLSELDDGPLESLADLAIRNHKIWSLEEEGKKHKTKKEEDQG